MSCFFFGGGAQERDPKRQRLAFGFPRHARRSKPPKRVASETQSSYVGLSIEGSTGQELDVGKHSLTDSEKNQSFEGNSDANGRVHFEETYVCCKGEIWCGGALQRETNVNLHPTT